MKRKYLTLGAMAMSFALIQAPVAAQASHPHLHINPKWKECSFQLDRSLTQSAWKQFTEEAGLVVYFRSLTDARPMGKGNFEISALQWQTNIDDSDAAWNDTFVHPDSAHWLFEGDGLKFPGLMLRAGVSSKTDVGVYVTKAPGANYGFYGGQVQRSLIGSPDGKWAAAARGSFVSMYGPDDLSFTVFGADLIASRTIRLASWASVSPYAGVSSYIAGSHEKSSVVNLDNERVLGGQATMGAAVQLSKARLAAEYNVAKVNSFSLKIGIGM
jgi:hypothetical protein